MLVATVELWPHGDAEKRKSLGTLTVALDRLPEGPYGDYRYELTSEPSPFAPELLTNGHVTAHYRSQPAWALVAAALDNWLKGLDGPFPGLGKTVAFRPLVHVSYDESFEPMRLKWLNKIAYRRGDGWHLDVGDDRDVAVLGPANVPLKDVAEWVRAWRPLRAPVSEDA